MTSNISNTAQPFGNQFFTKPKNADKLTFTDEKTTVDRLGKNLKLNARMSEYEMEVGTIKVSSQT